MEAGPGGNTTRSICSSEYSEAKQVCGGTGTLMALKIRPFGQSKLEEACQDLSKYGSERAGSTGHL